MEEILETIGYYGSEIKKVTAALQKAQGKFDTILKDTNNPFYKSKYATLDQVIAATRPHLTEEGLVLVQKNIQEGERYGIFTRLLHLESGEELTSSLIAKPKEDTIQQVTGILTYARRYEYLTLLGLAPEDDDGAVASGTTGARTETRPQSVQPKAEVKPHPYSGPVKAVIPPFPTTPNTTSTAFAANPSVLSTPVGPVVPSAAPHNIVSSQESTTPADPNSLPDQRQYDAYIAEAIKLTEQLEKAGLKSARGLSAKVKLKKYMCHAYKIADIKELTNFQWSDFLAAGAKTMSVPDDAAVFVQLVEAASAKETK
jgi:hypothetical protein